MKGISKIDGYLATLHFIQVLASNTVPWYYLGENTKIGDFIKSEREGKPLSSVAPVGFDAEKERRYQEWEKEKRGKVGDFVIPR